MSSLAAVSRPASQTGRGAGHGRVCGRGCELMAAVGEGSRRLESVYKYITDTMQTIEEEEYNTQYVGKC